MIPMAWMDGAQLSAVYTDGFAGSLALRTWPIEHRHFSGIPKNNQHGVLPQVLTMYKCSHGSGTGSRIRNGSSVKLPRRNWERICRSLPTIYVDEHQSVLQLYNQIGHR